VTVTGETRRPGGLSRRAFLRRGAAGGALIGASALLPGCSGAGHQVDGPDVGGFVDFYGAHQAGITLNPAPRLGLMAAFDVTAGSRAQLQHMFSRLTAVAAGLMAGEPVATRDPAYPPLDSGLLGPRPAGDRLTIVVSVGASLFDDRFGLVTRKPRELQPMPFLANDRLDPARSHGDLLISISADHPDTVQFALRQLMRSSRSDMVLRWTLDGYSRGTPGEAGSPRNLMGFKDGSANLDPDDADVMGRYVWVAHDDDEPDWTAGGSYHVARAIRMLVEFWDRVPLAEQEAIIGRNKISGAPLGQDSESQDPDMTGTAIPIDAHIRLANPRTPGSEDNLILRRGFNYSRGFDRAGQLDQGLAFVSFQRSLARGFLAVQKRLDGEPLEEYIRGEGGGFFFALPGVPDSGSSLAAGLFA
jgi:deferrochelatase/peroxidase EfeB